MSLELIGERYLLRDEGIDVLSSLSLDAFGPRRRLFRALAEPHPRLCCPSFVQHGVALSSSVQEVFVKVGNESSDGFWDILPFGNCALGFRQTFLQDRAFACYLQVTRCAHCIA